MPAVPKTNPSKSATFTRRDNGQYNPNAALEWTITFPAGPNSRVVLTDIAVEGVWEFDCATVTHAGGPEGTVTCDTGSLVIEYPDGYMSGAPVYTVRVNLLVPFEEGQVFENNATTQVWDYLYDPTWGEDGMQEGSGGTSIIQNRSQGGTGQIGEFRVSVGDYVWLDLDRDGLQGADEPGIPGVTVTLTGLDADNPSETITRTTVTDENGYYWFTDLASDGNYQLTFTEPTEFDGRALDGWTSQNAGDDSLDSDVNPEGIIEFVAPTMGANQPGAGSPDGSGPTDNPTLDAGVVLPLVSIGDYVWFDYNRDGQQGDPATEPPVAGVTVTLYGPNGEVVDSTTTDENGYYAFANLEPNTEYSLIFEKPDGYDGWTTQDAGDDASDSDVNPAGEVSFTSPSSGTNLTAPGEADNPTLDAGLVRLVSIGDYVWYDTNLDGQQGDPATEPPAAGLTVTLIDPDGNERTTTTDDSGYYFFDNLQPNTNYSLVFEKPEGYEWTSQDTGDDASDSDVDANGVINFTSSEYGSNLTGPNETDNPTLDAGLIRLVSVGDYVWFDENRDGIQSEGETPIAGVTVTISGPGGFEASTQTDENGYYNFKDLLPDTEYTLVFEKPDGYAGWTTQGEGANPDDSNVDAEGRVTFTSPSQGNNLIGPDAADNPTLDAGLIRLVSVGDYVWYDTDKDGVQDPNGKPAPGITVHLYEGEKIIGTTVTDENGYYYFQNLVPNTDYTLVFEKPEGYDWTSQGSGDNDALDSNVNPFGIIQFTTPGSGNNLVGVDATDNPTLDAGLIVVEPATPEPTEPGTPSPTDPATPAPTDPATPAPTDSATPTPASPVTGLPSTGSGTANLALGIAVATMAGMLLAAVGVRMNATKRS